MKKLNRRHFLRATGAASTLGALNLMADDKKPLFQVSLAQWTLVQSIRSGEIDNLDFAKVAAEHKIVGLEYVNQFFMDKAEDTAYLGKMKKRAADAGVQSLIIMCDREGNIGAPKAADRKKTVENHRKWISAAKFLGCHSIRVNAASAGSYEEQVKLAADGLAQLTAFGDEAEIDVIVENHGGLSSNGAWLAEVIKKVDHERCGTLPDFGNFRIKDDESYDSYKGIAELMPFAKGVSVKDRGWDGEGNAIDIDFEKMLTIVLESGFRGFCGIEYGGFAGLNQSRGALEAVREKLASKFS
ncbi:MAG: L-ribulose-5-phosphate 3-epimerase [Verrucomicrobiales bacterium]|jgi:L-ribulose-5-phosphate 3-epimerase